MDKKLIYKTQGPFQFEQAIITATPSEPMHQHRWIVVDWGIDNPQWGTPVIYEIEDEEDDLV